MVWYLLLFADDLANMAEFNKDLETMLNELQEWCHECNMSIQIDKTKIAYFRRGLHV